jgi:lysozyme
MKASEQLVDVLRDREKFRGIAYRDQGDVWTIGYGTTKAVRMGQTCTREQAEVWLRRDVATAERIVSRLGATLSQNQFDALVMFAYNTGTLGVKLAAALRAGEFGAVPDAMAEWVFVTDRSTGRKIRSNGLIARRAEEIAIFRFGEAA